MKSSKHLFSGFTNQYSVQKTLRFGLIPQGKTRETISNWTTELEEKNKNFEDILKENLLAQDKHRSESYKEVKKIIDKYHKLFIKTALYRFKLDNLENYYLYYKIPKRDEKEKKEFEEIQTNLRKQISNRFKKHNLFSRIDKKELIKEDLYKLELNESQKELVKEFEKFTTYFTGFHENRKNMYSSEEKSTAIAYRLIHQNLPKFIDNMRAFDKIKISPVRENFAIMMSDNELGPIIQVLKIEDMFMLDYFNETLTQKGIDIYNHLIGGYTPDEGKAKIKGLNEYINLYNQTAKKEERLPKLKPLYKQILSDRSTASFIPEQFDNDNEVLESIEKFYQELKEQVLNKKVKGEHSLKELLIELDEYDLYKIYMKNDLSLTNISKKYFGHWEIVQKGIGAYFERKEPKKLKETEEKYEERKNKFFKLHESYSIGFINDCMQSAGVQSSNGIENYFKLAGAIDNESRNLFTKIESTYNSISNLLNTPYPDKKDLAQDKNNVEKIKLFLDSIKNLQWFIKPLLGKGNESDKDEKFYGELSIIWTILDQITPLYNKVRNYMTRKPYSTEKIKLNFENSTLLDGWDVNKETDNTAIILRKKGLYYLGIMNKKHNKIFKKDFEITNGTYYEKMEYKLLPGANKMLPKVFFSNSRINEFNPSFELLENYKNETHKKGEKFRLDHCHNLIEFFKSSINEHEDWKQFGFKFSDTKSYEDLSGFYREVEQQGYKISFKSIPENYIDKLVDDNKLYLFQIYNKDFSPYSKGTPNMHTLYWKMLFDKENLKNVVYKLNGHAEVFFRKSSIKEENKIVHKANLPISNKNELKEKKQSRFDYDIIKDRRYTVDKFQFHVPITMNFKARGLNNINTEVNHLLEKENKIHIIGIDRGERHLLYITLIDIEGKIKKQFSLNEIINEYKGKTYKTNYRDLLDKREGNRDEARKNWKTIETIKELKEGYLSQVIHKIAKLMVEYNSIVVLEDLNTGFMRGRQKVEKQVYQKFEKMLIDKLNYLVTTKDIIKKNENGGVLKAYQLTDSYADFMKYKKKQCGFLFYVPAWNTSKMDPVTGFVNLFDTRYENMEKARSFFSKFDAIRYKLEKGYFEFKVKNYSKFNVKAEGTKQNWTICTYCNRIETFRNPDKNSQWDSSEIVLTDEFIKLFEQYKIDYKNPDTLKDLIIKQTEKEFFKSLLHLLKLTLQMRNSITGTKIDYLISPVANDKGKFYDSRTANDTLPKNADANGAYNIARKGLWVVEQIKQAEDLKKLKLAISNKEWLKFAQNK